MNCNISNSAMMMAKAVAAFICIVTLLMIFKQIMLRLKLKILVLMSSYRKISIAQFLLRHLRASHFYFILISLHIDLIWFTFHFVEDYFIFWVLWNNFFDISAFLFLQTQLFDHDELFVWKSGFCRDGGSERHLPGGKLARPSLGNAP